jgi:hypothetical protein
LPVPDRPPELKVLKVMGSAESGNVLGTQVKIKLVAVRLVKGSGPQMHSSPSTTRSHAPVLLVF